MPINGLTNAPKAFMQLGTIRKGEKQTVTRPDKTTYEKPVDLDYFRVTFKTGAQAGEIEKAFRIAYGERPTELHFRLAYHNIEECWDANMECYKQGGLIAKAGVKDTGPYWIYYRDPDDSEVLVRDGSPVGSRGRAFFDKPFNVDDPIYFNAKKEPAKMEPVGRLQVVIPEVAHLAVGYFVFQPGSPRDIRNITAELGAYDAIARQYGKTISGIPFKLIRREEEVTKNINGKLSKGPSWVVHVEVGGEWGKLAIAAIEQLALPEIVDAVAEDIVEYLPEETPVEYAKQLASVNAPIPVVEATEEMIDPLSPKAVEYAMKQWNTDEKATRKSISSNKKFVNPMAKKVFKDLVG